MSPLHMFTAVVCVHSFQKETELKYIIQNAICFLVYTIMYTELAVCTNLIRGMQLNN